MKFLLLIDRKHRRIEPADTTCVRAKRKSGEVFSTTHCADGVYHSCWLSIHARSLNTEMKAANYPHPSLTHIPIRSPDHRQIRSHE